MHVATTTEATSQVWMPRPNETIREHGNKLPEDLPLLDSHCEHNNLKGEAKGQCGPKNA